MSNHLLLVASLWFAAALLPAQTLVPGYYPGDVRLWDRMFQGNPELVQPVGTPVAGIAPHHDIDLLTLGRYYHSLRAQPPVVVLLSPNHFEWGMSPFVLARTTGFGTTEGVLVPDAPLTERLADGLGSLAVVTDKPWLQEHGVFTHAPFLKHFFPRARFVPILVEMGASQDAVERLARLLNDVLPAGALVLGSVDFSHYQIAAVAHFHDLSTAAVVRNLEYDRLLTREVDSPESVYAVSRFAQLRGAFGTQVALTSSGDFSKNPLSETTSHQYWTFVAGAPSPESRMTLVAAGRTAKPVNMGVPGSWVWDRYQSNPNSDIALLRTLAGKESRFLNGFDAYLIGLSPGWTERMINGLRCAFYGWNENLGFDRQRDEIAGRKVDFIAVVREPRGGGFSEDEAATLFAKGVALVLDRGAGSPIPPTLVSSGHGLWVRSLGDLISEGDGTGSILMASWTRSGWETKSFDLTIVAGEPQPIYQFPAEP